LLRALDAATVEVAALKAELARRQSQHRIFERPPLVIEDDDGTPVGVGPTCPNGCDPTGRNIIFGAHSWFCAVCGVQLV
jgi:hypothetical protein